MIFLHKGNKMKERKVTARRRGISVKSAFRRRIREFRIQSGLTINDVSAKAKVSERWIRNFENECYPKHFDEDPLIRLANAYGITFEELINGGDAPSSSQINATDFKSISEVFAKIDEGLIRIIRDLEKVHEHEVEDAYQDLLSARVKNHGLDLEVIKESLNNPDYINQLKQSLPEPDLTIEVDKAFSRLRFTDGEGITLVIDKPNLLWDCICQYPGRKPDPKICPIHSSEHGKAITEKFKTGYVLILYDGKPFYWKREESLWPPSVDSYKMMLDLESEGLLQNNIDSVLDIGSGTGFLGIVLAVENFNVTNLTLAD